MQVNLSVVDGLVIEAIRGRGGGLEGCTARQGLLAADGRLGKKWKLNMCPISRESGTILENKREINDIITCSKIGILVEKTLEKLHRNFETEI